MRWLAFVAMLAGCSAIEPDRTTWLVEQIQRDNAPWLSRDLDLLGYKFLRMSQDPYDYMRGTAGVYLRDLERTGGARATTSFLVDPEAAQVLVLGDPHPENFGCFLPGDPPLGGEHLRIEANDFDAAAFGPWILDVRRAAVGVRALFAGSAACDEGCQDGAAAAVARGWAEEIRAQVSGGETVDPTDRSASAIVRRLLDRCGTRGPREFILGRETRVGDDGLRSLRIDAEVDETGRANLALNPTDRAQIDRLMAQWSRRNSDFRVLDTGRSYGRGVASMPAIRFLVLIERGQGDEVEQLVLQVREVVDPPPIPGLVLPVEGLFPDQERRMVETPRLMWSRPDADPRLDAMLDGPVAFKVRSWESWWDGFDHGDIAADLDRRRIALDDVDKFARHLGRILAAHHARGRTATGWPALPALASDLEAGGLDALIDEIATASDRDWATIQDDFVRFQAALDELGPTLGVERIYVEEPRR